MMKAGRLCSLATPATRLEGGQRLLLGGAQVAVGQLGGSGAVTGAVALAVAGGRGGAGYAQLHAGFAFQDGAGRRSQRQGVVAVG